MFTLGTTRVVWSDLKPSFVIALFQTRVKAATVEMLFAPKWAPELFEVIDMGRVQTFLTQDDAERLAHEARAHVRAHWPHARLCIIVTSFSIPTLSLGRPVIADMAITCRQRIWMAKILNPHTLERMLKGAYVPYPAVYKETNKGLCEIVQSYAGISSSWPTYTEVLRFSKRS